MKRRVVSLSAAAMFLIGPAAFALLSVDAPVLSADVQYAGQVVKVDRVDHQVVVKNPQSGGRIRFTVTDKTAITSGNERKGLEDLRPGDAVEIEYVLEGDKYIANKMMVKPSGGK